MDILEIMELAFQAFPDEGLQVINCPVPGYKFRVSFNSSFCDCDSIEKGLRSIIDMWAPMHLRSVIETNKKLMLKID